MAIRLTGLKDVSYSHRDEQMCPILTVAYKTIDSLGPPLRLRLPKLKHISAAG